MTNKDKFLSSLFCPPLRLGNIKLEPLSAWHCCYLLQYDSPLLTGGDIRKVDVTLALRVLGLKYPQIIDPDDPDEMKMMAIVADEVNRNPEQSIETMVAHMANFLSIPKVWHSEGGRKSAVPYPLKLVVNALCYLNVTQEEAWNMPFNRLVAYWFAHSENQGLNIMTASEEAAVEALKGGLNG